MHLLPLALKRPGDMSHTDGSVIGEFAKGTAPTQWKAMCLLCAYCVPMYCFVRAKRITAPMLHTQITGKVCERGHGCVRATEERDLLPLTGFARAHS